MIPLFDKVIIDVKKQETITSSGIHLAVSDDKKLEQAEVVSVGEDCTKLKPGDKIVFRSYSIDSIELDGEEVSFIKEEDVLATL